MKYFREIQMKPQLIRRYCSEILELCSLSLFLLCPLLRGTTLEGFFGVHAAADSIQRRPSPQPHTVYGNMHMRLPM